MSSPTPFRAPPATRTPDGEPRRVGFELELTGVELANLADAVARHYGGAVEEVNPYRYRVAGTELGDFTVELDWALLSEAKLAGRLDELDPGEKVRELAAKLEKTAADIAGTVVPLEIVTPPLPIDRFATLDELRAALREMGATGTGGSLAYAFGLHLNPEAPEHDAGSILRHLRAFLLLHDWLVADGKTDLSRRLTPFIYPFPKRYVTEVMAAEYSPDLDALVADYLADNATRNRPLDLLPLFAWLGSERIDEALGDGLVKARPTYHYRLPDCRIGAPDWRIADEWNRWVLVEELAADIPRLDEMRAAFLELDAHPLSFLGTPWKKRVEDWL